MREIAGARDYLAQTPYRGLEGEIPFRASFKAAMDKGQGDHRDIVSDATQTRRCDGPEHHRCGCGQSQTGDKAMADTEKLKRRADKGAPAGARLFTDEERRAPTAGTDKR